MRRLSILLAFGLVFVLFVVAAATAAPPKDFCGPDGTKPDHWSCETTTQPPPPPPPNDPFPGCGFGDSGSLSWDGTTLLRCIWDADPIHEFNFQIDSDDVTFVKLPHMIVNDIVDGEIVYDDKCFDKTRGGIHELPFPGDDLWTFSPAGEGCGDGPYLLTVAAPVHKVKSGELELTDSNN